MFKRSLLFLSMVGLLTQSLTADHSTSIIKDNIAALRRTIQGERNINEGAAFISTVISLYALAFSAMGLFEVGPLITLDTVRCCAKFFAVSGAVAVYNFMQLDFAKRKINALVAIEDELRDDTYRA